jgi:hypothetical protein
MISTASFSFKLVSVGTNKVNQYRGQGSLEGRTNVATFDWIVAARNIRAKAKLSPDSTPLLREIREERSQRR